MSIDYSVMFENIRINILILVEMINIILCLDQALDGLQLGMVAQLCKTGMINSRGTFNKSGDDMHVQQGDHESEFVLVSGSNIGGREITFNRSGVNQIQFGKGAMRAGISGC
jgi:uncharacterized 2Fe-2S/4Fe-4S cluster protein (DUF4445 family)